MTRQPKRARFVRPDDSGIATAIDDPRLDRQKPVIDFIAGAPGGKDATRAKPNRKGNSFTLYLDTAILAAVDRARQRGLLKLSRSDFMRQAIVRELARLGEDGTE